jgi:hypothetical protein
MFYKVQKVEPLPDLNLLVCFANDEIKRYDVKPLIKEWQPFRSLDAVPGLFERVQVDIGGYGVIWDDNIDLSCNELYNNGISV